MTTNRKKCLAGLCLALIAGMLPGHATAQAQLPAVPAENVAGQAPVNTSEQVPTDLTLAAAGQDKPLPAPAAEKPADKPAAAEAGKDQTAAAPAVVDTRPEKIEVNFKEPESDILTKQAMDKLDVMVESLEFANADLQNVIRIIGERLNINFIFDAQDIDGKVTLRLRNIRLRDALDSILSTRKLAIIADKSGIFRIVPQERVGRKTVETKTEVLTLNWISAKDLIKTIKPFLSEDVGKMEFNEESNTLLLTDVPPQIEVVKNLIKQIDTPERQVLIEARLVDINIGAIRELGTQWTMSKTTPSSDLAAIGNSADTLGVVNMLNEGLGFNKGKGTLALGEKVGIFGSNYNLNAVFTALENRNVVEILANPRVTTLNNVPAQISIMEKIPYQTATPSSSKDSNTPVIEFEKAGVDIKVKPIITPNGFIRMDIKLIQTINRGRVGDDPLGPPLIDERNAETNVIVKDANTVVLGGLRQVRKNETINGVPWLHRVPFFGWLFKDKSYDQSKTELVLMMTPKIITDTLKMTGRENQLYKKIDVDWHLPDYFLDDTKGPDDNAKFKK